MKRTIPEKFFQVFNIILLTLILMTILFPVLHITALSVSNQDAILSRRVTVYPIGFQTDAYKDVMGNSLFARSMLNTVGITAVGTTLAILVSVLTAYGLTKNFVGKKVITYLFVITMYFSGGLIPTYIVYTSVFHLRNNFLVLILPSLVSMFYIIVVRSQIENMPSSVFEAAYLDGAREYQTVFYVVVPMIAPTIAAVSMFFALGFWNSWFNVMVYTDKNTMWTLQYFLRVVVFSKFISQYNNSLSSAVMAAADRISIPEENFRMAAIVLTAAPIVAIYPFLQKYFVRGIISGAVKG
jgi:putative aldouronate transport system permease protein